MPRILSGVAAVIEIAAGLIWVASPPLVSRLLLGVDVSGAGIVLGRVAGCAVLALGVACWPDRAASTRGPALRGLLCYNLLVTIYLVLLGIRGEAEGVLLWPAAALHALLTLLLTVGWLAARPSPLSGSSRTAAR